MRGARIQPGSRRERDEHEAGREGCAVHAEQNGSQARDPRRARRSAPKLARNGKSADGNDRRSDEDSQTKVLAEQRKRTSSKPQHRGRKRQHPIPLAAGEMPGGLPGDTEGEETERIGDVDREKAGERVLGDHESRGRRAKGERDRPHAERRHVPVLQPRQREKTGENRANDEKHGRQCLSVESHERQFPQPKRANNHGRGKQPLTRTRTGRTHDGFADRHRGQLAEKSYFCAHVTTLHPHLGKHGHLAVDVDELTRRAKNVEKAGLVQRVLPRHSRKCCLDAIYPEKRDSAEKRDAIGGLVVRAIRDHEGFVVAPLRHLVVDSPAPIIKLDGLVFVSDLESVRQSGSERLAK